METFATRLAQAIEHSGLTRPEFAARSGVGTSALAKWLASKLMPKSEQLLALARTAGVSMEWLLTGDAAANPRRWAEPSVLREDERPYGSKASASNLKAAAKSAEVLASKLREAESELARLRSFLG
jgi:transcriptional regulator with XRE-family HTH domain